ncbi:MAG: hypothetical protein L6Q97_08355, partial [Thermoanaerobaculia bacterium]|nr:hypothetical protein [Thermoanaerobaculia bacterium]
MFYGQFLGSNIRYFTAEQKKEHLSHTRVDEDNRRLFNNMAIDSFPLIVDNLLVFANSENAIECWQFPEWKRVWKSDFQNLSDEINHESASLLYANERFVIANIFPFFVCVELASGRLIWKIDSNIVANPKSVLVKEDSLLFFGVSLEDDELTDKIVELKLNNPLLSESNIVNSPVFVLNDACFEDHIIIGYNTEGRVNAFIKSFNYKTLKTRWEVEFSHIGEAIHPVNGKKMPAS